MPGHATLSESQFPSAPLQANTSEARLPSQPARFGRVPVWYDETGPSLTTAVTIALLAFGFLMFMNSRPKRSPLVVATVSMQPVVSDVRGLQGGSTGSSDRNRLSFVDRESLETRVTPQDDSPLREQDFPDTQPNTEIRRATVETESGNVADLLEQTAARLRTVDELIDSAREQTRSADAAAGQGISGAEPGDQPSARFFGLGADGADSVVYVIDSSGSMDNPQKIGVAKRELIRSIRGLRRDQKFYIVFFHGKAIRMPGDVLVPATEENKMRAIDWIETVAANGSTHPVPALEIALKLRPQVIYLLSDGQFRAQYAQEIGRKNRGLHRATIYTVGFGDRSSEAPLLRIADDSGGAYRFVDFTQAAK